MNVKNIAQYPAQGRHSVKRMREVEKERGEQKVPTKAADPPRSLSE